jgi:uncharacterized protein YjbJ (UPF0337 family)
MNWDQIKGDWHQLSARLKEKWAKLTNEELATIAGRRMQLAVVLQGHYGYEKQRADTEINQFVDEITS